MINPISTALSGLMASSKKAEVAATNIANADVVGSTDPKSPDQAYAARMTQDITTGGGDVKAVVLERTPPFLPTYSPDSPFADAEGMVNSPNVSMDEEMLNMKMASNAYQANVTSLKTGIEMQDTLHEALDHKA